MKTCQLVVALAGINLLLASITTITPDFLGTTFGRLTQKLSKIKK